MAKNSAEQAQTEETGKGGRKAMVVEHQGKLYKITQKGFRSVLLRFATKGKVDVSKFGKELGQIQVNLDTMTQDEALTQLDQYI